MNLLDNASNLLTNFLSGGKITSMPVAEGISFSLPFVIEMESMGVLADILESITGKGLIPADLDSWKQRRRVIAPGFHALYLEAMVKVFGDCSERMTGKVEQLLEAEASRGGKTIELDLESEFSSSALDIIGLGVFNYDFGSVTKESPVFKAV